MDIENFVQSIKFYCAAKGIKPTVACRESGVGGSFINNMESRGSVPSVEKVQLLAQYLGVTVSELLGETGPPPNPTLESDLPPQAAPDVMMLRLPSSSQITAEEADMIEAYRHADDDTRTIVDTALRKYKQKESSASVG